MSNILEKVDKSLLGHYVQECLSSRRWGGSPSLMLLDAAFTSVGLSYFGVVVPKVAEAGRLFPNLSFSSLSKQRTPSGKQLALFGNRRSWRLAFDVAGILSGYGNDDLGALKSWAREADHHTWASNPIGKVRGVGISTFQYLRMQGGVDTSMPDKIVLRVLSREYGTDFPKSPEESIDAIGKLARRVRSSPIELTWAAWLLETDNIEISRKNPYFPREKAKS